MRYDISIMNKKYKSAIHPAIIIAIFIGVFALQYGLEKFACHSYEIDTNLKTKYTIMNGCLVNTKNGWRALKTLRSFEENN